jgi:hypothetical protein
MWRLGVLILSGGNIVEPEALAQTVKLVRRSCRLLIPIDGPGGLDKMRNRNLADRRYI